MYHPNKIPHPVRLYDLSILNIQERREQCLDFPCLKDAADYLGVTPATVRNNLGGRLLSHKRGRRYAVRSLTLGHGQEATRADPKRA